jgi:hypothetical protein
MAFDSATGGFTELPAASAEADYLTLTDKSVSQAGRYHVETIESGAWLIDMGETTLAGTPKAKRINW